MHENNSDKEAQAKEPAPGRMPQEQNLISDRQ
jgi:hypothetical protein